MPWKAGGYTEVSMYTEKAVVLRHHSNAHARTHLQRVLHPLAMPACTQVLLRLQPRLLGICGGEANENGSSSNT
jgi:hypothetical protein